MEEPRSARRDLYDLEKRVYDRESFLAFVQALADDREGEVMEEKTTPSSPWGPGAHGWENGSIEQFLDAALRWAHDSGQLPAEPSWQAFAQFLHLGKLYE